MPKTIFTSLSPNVEADDIKLALKLLFTPWKWKTGDCVNTLEQKFKKYLDVKYGTSFVSGRGCLLAILKSLNLNSENEVLLQAYTCVAVPAPVLWVGAKPIYVDIEEDTFNMDPEDLRKKITPKSKVLIIQHTFGRPAKTDELVQIAKEYNLFVIEDCAHIINSEIGQKGDVAFFSFGRDKVISSVFGGMVTTNNQELAQKIDKIHTQSSYPDLIWIKKQLLHPVITSFAKKTYNVLSIGKLAMFLSKKLHILTKAVQAEEKTGGQPEFLSKKMPNALACLALNQFNKLDKINNHRKNLAKIYGAQDDNAYLRYTVQVDNPQELIQRAKQQNILLDDWYCPNIAPRGVDNNAISYKEGSCPVAEAVAKKSINLPINIQITESDAKKIADLAK